MSIDFEQLFETHFSKIFNYIFFRVGNQTVAEDLTSETFLRAMSYSEKYDAKKSAPHTWLCAIAKNVINDYLSKTGKVSIIELDANLPAISDISTDAERAELYRKLAEIVFQLPNRQREIITMKYILGMTKREIAEQMNMSVSNVGVTLHRIVKELRKKLDGYM